MEVSISSRLGDLRSSGSLVSSLASVLLCRFVDRIRSRRFFVFNGGFSINPSRSLATTVSGVDDRIELSGEGFTTTPAS
jgi:hypothetical protein